MDRAVASLLSLLPLSLISCGGSKAVDCTPSGGAEEAKYVADSVTVPQSYKDFAIDLNGDGEVDNQIGNLVAALSAGGFDIQGGVDESLAAGSLILLFDARSTDPSFRKDRCAATTVQLGQPMPMPDFSGAGHFTPDASKTAGTFHSPLVDGRFDSPPPPATKGPVSVTIALPLTGSEPVPLNLIGAHLQYTRDDRGKLIGGQLQGAIPQGDVQTQIVPAVARLLTAKVQQPMTPDDMKLGAFFDTGGTPDPACSAGTCKNPDGSCAVAGDKKIDICEVATHPVVSRLLEPDVQMTDGEGHYAPNKQNGQKDSLSLGLGFGAVGAAF